MAGGGERVAHGRAALIDPLAGGSSRADRDDRGAHRAQGARYSPLRPPLFATRRTSVMRAPRSIALSMSYSVRAAIDTAVSASISTPVCAVVATVASIAMPFVSMTR